MDNSILSFVGIDIAKRSLDLHCRPDNRELSTSNDEPGFKEVLEFLRKLLVILNTMVKTNTHWKHGNP